ncbi:MAG: glycoside hydrolase, partial [Actinobacteria bacterium]|nr:glycoside hydrolase [Actinomycetota bacterium]
NLANIAFSKSTDSGRTYTLQNVAGITFTDRQWMEADQEDVFWFVGNTFGGGSPAAGEPLTGSLDNRLYKTTDGGKTFSEGQSMGGQQSSEIVLDKNTGALFQIHEDDPDLGDDTIGMRVFANARNETPPDVTFTDNLIADQHSEVSSIGPTPAIDADGNLYVVWDEDGELREQGIWFSASDDGGTTWSTPVRVNEGPEFAFWPWVAVGDAGNVSVTWLEHETPIESNDPEQADAGWNVMVALTRTGLGCDGSDVPGFQVTRASSEPIHTGTVCNGGTICQAEAVDRRLGDYFANTVAADGMTVVSVSDTRQGGSVALPLAVRQVSGPSLRAAVAPAVPAEAAEPTAADAGASPLPTTGGGLALAGLGLVGLAATARRRRT